VVRVLVVEDDPAVVGPLVGRLRALGHDVRTRPTLAGGLLAAVEERVDLLLVDVELEGGRRGDDLLALLDRGVGRPRLTCLMAEGDDRQVRTVAERAGALLLRKPVDASALDEVVSRAQRDAG
jgi:DNA-binding response OmpR family regulator